MRGFVAAFVKVGAPGLTPDHTERPGILFQQGKGQGEFQKPGRRSGDRRFNARGKAGHKSDPLIVFGSQGHEFLKPPVYACRIHHVRRKQCTAAIKLKIKVPSGAFRLNKKFHATVFPDLTLKAGVDASHVLFLHAKDSIEVLFVIQKPALCPRSMIAAFRPYTIHVQKLSPPPHRAVP